MRPKRRKRQRANIRPSKRVDCLPHLQWVRGHECLVNDKNYVRKMQAHHVRYGSHTGMNQTPGDDRAVPLCGDLWDGHHAEYHDKGHHTFEKKYGLDTEKTAADLWRYSPHGIKYRIEHGL